MNKTFLFLLFLACFCLPIASSAQSGSEKGSAANLEGNVYILSVFITTPDEGWTLEEKIDLTSKQAQAEDWLKREAQKYGRDLSFRVGSFGIDKDIVYDNIELFGQNGSVKYDWINNVLTKIGYLSDQEFYDLTKEIYGADEVLVLIYANQKGTGYSLVQDNGDANIAFVEGSVLCRFYNDGTEIQPATIGQDILRTFGAWNLYETSSASSEYPNDIMYRITDNLSDLEIGEVTAWRVGWANEKSDYNTYRPQDK